MAAINNDWLDALKGEFSKPYYKKLFETVNQEYRTHRVYPPADDIFNAFHLTPLKDVKVVILGQDPYHGDGQAEGLSFSVKMFLIGIISYAAVALLEYRKIRKVPMDEALKNVE